MFNLHTSNGEAMSGKYELPRVSFDSELIGLTFELERLRGNFGVTATTPSDRLLALHSFFQLLMSVVSARIEGNRTTVYDAVRHGGDTPPTEGLKEIRKLRDAITYIDSLDPKQPITHTLIRELHDLSVSGLTREGDRTPGQYRAMDVLIAEATHVPPSHTLVHPEMSSWLEFANQEPQGHLQMIHVALAHHRFLWIHPFGNGNGRVSRLISYVMLRRHGFTSPVGLRTVNPTAVFGNDRDGYYSALAAADRLDNEGTVEWCTFFVRGLHEDLTRMTDLQDNEFVITNLIHPTIERLRLSGVITKRDADVLKIAAVKNHVRAGDLESAIPGTAAQRSRAIRDMINGNLLEPTAANARSYRLNLNGRPFGPFLIPELDRLGFLPKILRDDPA